MIQKARNATQLHIATLGRANFIGNNRWDPKRAAGDELARRYGMWAARCIQINADVAASVPFKLMTVDRSADRRATLTRIGRYKPVTKRTLSYLTGRMGVQPSQSVRKFMRQGSLDDLVEIEEHPLLDLMHDVNEWTDGYAFRESLYSDLQLFGRAFSLVVDPGGSPESMWRMLPQKMHVKRDPVNFVSHFEMNEGADMRRFTVDEVLWFRMYDPADPWGGVGPVEAWLKTIDASFHIQEFQNELMLRFGAPDYVVTSEAPMSEDQKRSFRRHWAAIFGRFFNRRENIAFLSGTSKLERLGQTNRELEFGDSEDRKRDQIGQAFGVPKSMLDVSEIKANSREARQQHMETTIWPMVQRVEDVWNARLCPRWSDGLFLVHENPIPDDQQIEIANRESKLKSGWTVNEIRVAEGEEPLDGDGDLPMIAAGLVPLGTVGAESEPGGLDQDGEAAGSASPELVLQGTQITAATAIIQAVIDGQLPIESARGQLMVMFHLTSEQADQMLAGVEDFEPEPPQMPMLPNGQQAPPPPGQQQPADQETRMLVYSQIMDKLWQTRQQPVPVQHMIQLEPHVIIHQHAPEAPIFHLEPAQIAVYPQLEAKAPDVYVEAPNVTVNPQMPAPVVHVDAPHVDVHPPEVHVEAPVVNVAAPHVDVQPPEVKVEVKAPSVLVNPEIEVHV